MTLVSKALTFSLIGFACVAFTTQAEAAVTPQQVAKAKSVVENYLAMIERNYGAQGVQVIKKGEMTAEGKDTYIAIKTPHITFKSEGGIEVNAGVFSINALPTTADGLTTFTGAFATPMGVILPGKKGQSDHFLVNIPKQNMSATFDDNAQHLVKYNALLSDISVTKTADTGAITIGSLAIMQDFKRGANNLYSGPMNVEAKNLNFTDPQNRNQFFKIAAIRLTTQTQDLDFKIQKSFEENIQALTEAEKGSGADEMSAKHSLALYNTLIDGLTKSAAGFASQIQVDGLVARKRNEATGAIEDISIGALGFGFDATGLKGNSAGLALRLSLQGFSGPDLKASYGIAPPQSINLDVRAKNVPLRDLTDTGKTLVKSTLEQPETASMAGLQAMVALPGMLTNAKTQLDITDISVQSPEYSGKLTGNIITNMNAVNGVTAKMMGTVTGLDGVLQKLTAAQPTVTDPADQKSLREALQTLTMLQALGQLKGNARIYDIQVTEQGQTLVNGSDLSTLTGGAGGGI